jgi:hypothetical protein
VEEVVGEELPLVTLDQQHVLPPASQDFALLHSLQVVKLEAEAVEVAHVIGADRWVGEELEKVAAEEQERQAEVVLMKRAEVVRKMEEVVVLIMRHPKKQPRKVFVSPEEVEEASSQSEGEVPLEMPQMQDEVLKALPSFVDWQLRVQMRAY